MLRKILIWIVVAVAVIIYASYATFSAEVPSNLGIKETYFVDERMVVVTGLDNSPLMFVIEFNNTKSGEVTNVEAFFIARDEKAKLSAYLLDRRVEGNPEEKIPEEVLKFVSFIKMRMYDSAVYELRYIFDTAKKVKKKEGI